MLILYYGKLSLEKLSYVRRFYQPPPIRHEYNFYIIFNTDSHIFFTFSTPTTRKNYTLEPAEILEKLKKVKKYLTFDKK